jgi:PAS domain S-box-containing protein
MIRSGATIKLDKHLWESSATAVCAHSPIVKTKHNLVQCKDSPPTYLTTVQYDKKLMDALRTSTLPSSERTMSQEVSPRWLLTQLLKVTAVSMILADIFFLFSGRFSSADALMNLVYGLLLLLGTALVRTNHIWLASHYFTAVLWLSLTVFMAILGGSNTPGPGGYIIIILVAALLLRGRVTFVYTVFSISATMLLVIASGAGYVPLNGVPPSFLISIGNTFTKMFITLSLLGIAYYGLRCTLATLRFNEYDLNQIRQTLGQRTADLSVINEQLRYEINERQQTEIALEQQRSFLRQIIDTMPNYVFVKDSESRFLIINKALATAYKSTPEDIEGRLAEVVGSNQQKIAKFEDGDQAVLASGIELFWPELPFIDLDGKKHWLQVVKRPFFDKTNNVTHVLGIASDITQIKQAAELLREKEENFRTLVEASFEGIIICVNHIIQEANNSFADMFGYTAVAELLGKNAAAFLTPESTVAMQQLMQKEQKVTLEAVGVRKDNNTFPVEVVSHSINFQGNQAQISGYRDISTRKQAEQAEQHAQKLRSLSIMAGGLAHDFNNLLVAVMGQISIAKAKINPNHPSHINLDKAMQATETTALLTRQLLAYTGQGHFEVKPIHLNHLISQNLQLFQDALPPNITFQTNLHDPLPYIEVDSAQIQQIIMNLLLNAAEAIGTKVGSITITTAPYQLTADQITKWQQTNETVAPGHYVLLEVSDTGQGMDEATLSHIFDPFYSTKGTGRGLGLAAVLGIVRGHNGSLRVQSQIGEGTLFQFLFPRDEAEQPGQETAVSPPETYRNTVLIIDDEKQVREAISDILDLKEIPSLLAASGQEGINLFTAHLNQIGFVVLDLSMPGMSGLETFEALRIIEPDVKIILSSGYTEAEILQKMAGAQPTGFLQKPYRLEAVLALVDNYLL